MNVSGVRPYAGFYQYNSIKLNELRGQQISAAQANRAHAEQPEANAEEEAKKREQEIAAAKENQTFSSYDYAKQYRPDEEFDLKGAMSDINNLDMEKAISGMEKDQVIRQYQYFVGDKNLPDLIATDAALAPLRSGENFVL